MRLSTLKLFKLLALMLSILLQPPAFADNVHPKETSTPAADNAEIDIGLAALTLAQEFYPGLDVEAYSRRIDQLASKVWWLAKNTTDPEQRIRALNTVLFRNEGFHYDRRPDARSKQDYYFLNGILDTKQGICYTLPLLYVAVAQRLGYPIYPVAAPDHMFVRYADPAFKEQNIETTSGGKYLPDANGTNFSYNPMIHNIKPATLL